jgi:Flp pilus assembly pilin Flp
MCLPTIDFSALRLHKFDLTTALRPGIMECTTGVTVEGSMGKLAQRFWSEDQGQDIAEYAVMLAVILVLVVGTIRLIGGNANNAFSATASAITQ